MWLQHYYLLRMPHVKYDCPWLVAKKKNDMPMSLLDAEQEDKDKFVHEVGV